MSASSLHAIRQCLHACAATLFSAFVQLACGKVLCQNVQQHAYARCVDVFTYLSELSHAHSHPKIMIVCSPGDGKAFMAKSAHMIRHALT